MVLLFAKSETIYSKMYKILLPMEYSLILLDQEKILLDSTDGWDLLMQKFQQSKVSIGILEKTSIFCLQGLVTMKNLLWNFTTRQTFIRVTTWTS